MAQGARFRRAATEGEVGPVETKGESSIVSGDQNGLQVENLTVRFGGLVAVSGVSLKASAGAITGLIGPNGAGKTTTFNACTGLVQASEGRVVVNGRDVTRASPQRRAGLGLGRTFQRMELFETLTVRDNVALGRTARLAGANPWRHVRLSRSARVDVQERAESAMTRCGLLDLADRRPSQLSTGSRRLVELARAIASGADLLLLDEPSSGLDTKESAAFGVILRQLAAESEGILLVEHDMELVMSVCDYVYVLDFGNLIFEGTPNEVATNEVVRAAYLGAKQVEAAS